jgi:hypothetical protein
MCSTVAVNGSFLNTQRTPTQYVVDAYFSKGKDSETGIGAGETKSPAEMAYTC